MPKYIPGIYTGYKNGLNQKLWSGQMCKIGNVIMHDRAIIDGLPKPLRWSPEMGFSWGGYPLEFSVCDNLVIVKNITWLQRFLAPFRFALWAWFQK